MEGWDGRGVLTAAISPRKGITCIGEWAVTAYLSNDPTGWRRCVHQDVEYGHHLPEHLEGPRDEEGQRLGLERGRQRGQREDVDPRVTVQMRVQWTLVVTDEVDYAPVSGDADGMVLHARAPSYVSQDENLDVAVPRSS